MKSLCVHAIETRIFHQGEDLARFIAESVARERIFDKMVLAVTSKIVSLAENRVVPRAAVVKSELVEGEADVFFGEIGHGCFLTIKSGHLLLSSGIDESNSESGGYILYPKDPMASAGRLRRELIKIWNLEQLGVVLTDSHSTPLRRGVTGMALSYAGFRAIRNMVGSKDLFGREIKMTQVNFADGVAAAAVMMMGECAESRPIAVIENAGVEFTDVVDASEIEIALEDDLYYPLLRSFRRPPP